MAWSWIGSDKIESRLCTPLGLFGHPELRAQMLAPLLSQIDEADILTGHNIVRFDLPVINSECLRLGLEPIRYARVQDTMWITKAKGFKKGQDNLGHLLKTREDKLPLDWQQWQDAYDAKDWATIRLRAESDVIQHKEIRQIMIDRRMLNYRFERAFRG